MIRKIVSGGQTGADQAALDVAIERGIPHGGWVPEGRKTEAGPLPEKYRVQEMPTSHYEARTEQNVIDSDGTLLVSHGALTGGSKLTRQFAQGHKKEWLHIDLDRIRGFSAAQLIQAWIVRNDIRILNVAGPRASEDPDIYDDTVRLLKAVMHLFFIDAKKSAPDNRKPLYPRTVDDAVDRLLSELPFRARTRISKMDEHDLVFLHPTLGGYIRDNYGLGSKNGTLMKDCRFTAKNSNMTQDDATALIIKELWYSLKKTHALRVMEK